MIYSFKSDKFENTDWLSHFFFSRLGGVSAGEYASLNCSLGRETDIPNVKENHKIVAKEIGIPVENLLFLNQIHSTKAVKVTELWNNDKRPDADAMVTNKPNVALAVITADCVPVLFADKQAKIIGAAHSGWKGTLEGVLESTVNAMKELGADPANIEAAIGPCIAFSSYEVQEDFRAEFIAKDKDSEMFFIPSPRKGRWLCNLSGYVAFRLKRAGVKIVYDIEQDTVVNEKFFFSNRRAFMRSQKSYGLQPSVIMIKE